MKITIDPARCAGHAQCAAAAPDLYDLDDLGYALPIVGEVDEAAATRADAGASACPERAITIDHRPADPGR